MFKVVGYKGIARFAGPSEEEWSTYNDCYAFLNLANPLADLENIEVCSW